MVVKSNKILAKRECSERATGRTINYFTGINRLALIFLLFLSPIIFQSKAFSKDNIDFLLRNNKNPSAEIHLSDQQQRKINEISLLGLGLIKFYQLFISTQDEPVCNFTLSCSNFGLESIKNRGLFFGILLTADRLSRCNTLTQKYYKIDPETKNAIDNVPLFYFNK
ncbi:MAG: hypothetical protein HW421_2190 [Ignavibacteria bacterium]|nr:hypothetical protein [Ignavibacteria bacterium]